MRDLEFEHGQGKGIRGQSDREPEELRHGRFPHRPAETLFCKNPGMLKRAASLSHETALYHRQSTSRWSWSAKSKLLRDSITLSTLLRLADLQAMVDFQNSLPGIFTAKRRNDRRIGR